MRFNPMQSNKFKQVILTNRGWLKHGNPPGDFMTAPRCGAKTRNGTSCQAPAMLNGRCRMHGGKSTGPKTIDGKERSRQAHFKHGYYTQVCISERKEFSAFLHQLQENLI